MPKATTASSPLRTQARRSKETRRLLFDAAIECLVASGYAGSSAADVARHAGCSPGRLLHQFPTKADLFCAAADDIYARRVASLRRASALLSPQSDVEQVVELLWRHLSDRLALASVELLVAARTDRELRRRFRRSVAEYEALLSRALSELLSGRSSDAVRVGVAALQALVLRRILFSSRNEKETFLSAVRQLIEQS